MSNISQNGIYKFTVYKNKEFCSLFNFNTKCDRTGDIVLIKRTGVYIKLNKDDDNIKIPASIQ